MPCFPVNRCLVSVEGLHDLSQDLLAGDLYCFSFVVLVSFFEQWVVFLDISFVAFGKK
jgi:hypothetical protein